MVRAHWPTTDPDHRHIEARIRYWTRRLAESHRFTGEDREDVAQEFRLVLFLRLRAFDARRASRRTYIARIVENHARTINEASRAAKRDDRKVAFSLDAPTDPQKPEALTHGDVLGADEFDRVFHGCNASRESRQDLTITVSMAMDRMPEPLQRVCELRRQGFNVTEISKQLGLHRSTVSERVAEIRRRLKAAGFE